MDVADKAPANASKALRQRSEKVYRDRLAYVVAALNNIYHLSTDPQILFNVFASTCLMKRLRQ